MKKRNILILSPDRPVYPMGGLGVHVDKLLSNINAEQFNVTALCQGAADCTMPNGVKVYGVDPSFPLTSTKDSFARTFLLQSRFSALAMSLLSQRKMPKPHIVHIMDWSTAVAGLDIAAVTGAKPVFAVHLSIGNYIKSPSPMQRSNWDEAKQIEFLACQKSFRVLQVSKSYSELYPFNFFSHKTSIIPNGIDLSDFDFSIISHLPATHLPGKSIKKILYVGRIASMKNVQTLMDINMPGGCDLIFIGGDQGSSQPLIDRLKTVCDNDPNKFYMGAVYSEEKNYLMTQADLVIVPSVHEPFGIVALEALAAAQGGRTILASSFVGGMGDFLTPDAALNCGVTKESIEDCIARFLSMTDDEKSAMRTAAVELAGRYTWQNTTNEIESVYNSIL